MTIERHYNTIIVGIDGSESSHIAFKEAVSIAKMYHAKLFAIHVINNIANYLPEDALNALTTEAEENLANLKEQAENNEFNDVFTLVVEGSPKKMLSLTLPTDLKADLIVLGATGKHMISESVLGSIAHYASSNAHCSVLIVRQ
ncbi:universal stress protein [Vagococcus zengguangii]|uniref:Universal stress protein n=1 Tax=Vagococcus zengguangii TaxID=2571750 RepID=A0A4D7CUQ1_9ENTE|nr:universal stress protein [Vagococcus zengguangii]QCI86020.1 universal stress protein [Vagococcus zengguangii]TLG80236.1 universal stress protein [Vagococcus zengguangii]